MNNAHRGEESGDDTPETRLPPFAIDDVHQHRGPAHGHQNRSALQAEDTPMDQTNAVRIVRHAWIKLNADSGQGKLPGMRLTGFSGHVTPGSRRAHSRQHTAHSRRGKYAKTSCEHVRHRSRQKPKGINGSEGPKS